MDWFQKEANRKRRYQEVFGTVPGQAVLLELLMANNVFSQPSALAEDGRIDPYRVTYNEGRRAAALDVLQTLDMPLEQMRRMFEEQQRKTESEQ